MTANVLAIGSVGGKNGQCHTELDSSMVAVHRKWDGSSGYAYKVARVRACIMAGTVGRK